MYNKASPNNNTSAADACLQLSEEDAQEDYRREEESEADNALEAGGREGVGVRRGQKSRMRENSQTSPMTPTPTRKKIMCWSLLTIICLVILGVLCWGCCLGVWAISTFSLICMAVYKRSSRMVNESSQILSERTNDFKNVFTFPCTVSFRDFIIKAVEEPNAREQTSDKPMETPTEPDPLIDPVWDAFLVACLALSLVLSVSTFPVCIALDILTIWTYRIPKWVYDSLQKALRQRKAASKADNENKDQERKEKFPITHLENGLSELARRGFNYRTLNALLLEQCDYDIEKVLD